MSVALDLLSRDGKTSYRVAIGRKYDSVTSYEISTNDIAEARAFLLTYHEGRDRESGIDHQRDGRRCLSPARGGPSAVESTDRREDLTTAPIC